MFCHLAKLLMVINLFFTSMEIFITWQMSCHFSPINFSPIKYKTMSTHCIQQGLFKQFIVCNNHMQSPALFQNIKLCTFLPKFQIFCPFLSFFCPSIFFLSLDVLHINLSECQNLLEKLILQKSYSLQCMSSIMSWNNVILKC